MQRDRTPWAGQPRRTILGFLSHLLQGGPPYLDPGPPKTSNNVGDCQNCGPFLGP